LSPSIARMHTTAYLTRLNEEPHARLPPKCKDTTAQKGAFMMQAGTLGAYQYTPMHTMVRMRVGHVLGEHILLLCHSPLCHSGAITDHTKPCLLPSTSLRKMPSGIQAPPPVAWPSSVSHQTTNEPPITTHSSCRCSAPKANTHHRGLAPRTSQHAAGFTAKSICSGKEGLPVTRHSISSATAKIHHKQASAGYRQCGCWLGLVPLL
jgi:hypothetical protein